MSDHIPTTAKEADAFGLLYYQAPKPCKRGHLSLRRVANGQCMDCEALRKKEKRARDRTVSPKKLAELNGEKTYHGKNCEVCDTTLKYTNSSHCVKCSNHRMTHYEIKLLIIRKPGLTINQYARRARRKASAIYDAFQALNITRSTKPPHYVG